MSRPAKPLVATARRRAYSGAMVGRRLLHLLALVALVLAPLGMAGGHAAMSMPVQPSQHAMVMSADRCDGMSHPAKDQPSSCVDCLMVCSGLPAADVDTHVHPLAAAPMPPVPAQHRVKGLNPESDPPPPRLA